MTADTHYDTDHLSTAEIKEVAEAVHRHYMSVMHGNENDMDYEELHEEYMFWIGKYEERLCHGDPAAQDY